jgi:twinkle protein
MSGLVEVGIRLKSETLGEHRTACPECARTKQRPRDDALAVKVEPEGSATWCCHRCSWKGAVPASGEPHRPRTRVQAPASRDRAQTSANGP